MPGNPADDALGMRRIVIGVAAVGLLPMAASVALAQEIGRRATGIFNAFLGEGASYPRLVSFFLESSALLWLLPILSAGWILGFVRSRYTTWHAALLLLAVYLVPLAVGLLYWWSIEDMCAHITWSLSP